MTLPVDAPRIGADRLPVTVFREDSPDAAMTKVRAVLTVADGNGEGWLFVWASPNPQNPDVNLRYRRAESTIGPASADWRIATDDGVWVIRGERGCCSPLAHFPWPWPTYRMGTL